MKYIFSFILFVALSLGIRVYMEHATFAYLDSSIGANQASVFSADGISQYISNLENKTLPSCYTPKDVATLQENQKQILSHIESVANESNSVVAFVDDLTLQKTKLELQIATSTKGLIPTEVISKLKEKVDTYTKEISDKNSLLDMAKKRDQKILEIETEVKKYKAELPKLKTSLAAEQKNLNLLTEAVPARAIVDQRYAALLSAQKAFQSVRPGNPRYMSLYQAYISANAAYQNAYYAYMIRYQRTPMVLNLFQANTATSSLARQQSVVSNLTQKISVYELGISNSERDISNVKSDYSLIFLTYLKQYQRTEKDFAEPVSKLVAEKQKVEKEYMDMFKKNETILASVATLQKQLDTIHTDIEQYAVKRALYKELQNKLMDLKVKNDEEIVYASTKTCSLTSSVSTSTAVVPETYTVPVMPVENQGQVVTPDVTSKPMGSASLCGNGDIEEGEECDGTIPNGYCSSCIVQCWGGYERATRGFIGRILNEGDIYCKKSKTQSQPSTSSGSCKPPTWGVGGNFFGVTVNPQNLNPCPKPNEGEGMCLNGWEVDYSYQGQNRTWRCVLNKYEICGNDVKETFVAQRICSASN
ncbi:MAG: hypothetical protein FGM57_02790 [Candidatus Taylorbacteria bacterium]|nr:hypothetical protein [Candidatus Taylorbacteria bacterium]